MCIFLPYAMSLAKTKKDILYLLLGKMKIPFENLYPYWNDLGIMLEYKLLTFSKPYNHLHNLGNQPKCIWIIFYGSPLLDKP